jgi:DNA-binding NtrC family response regulator
VKPTPRPEQQPEQQTAPHDVPRILIVDDEPDMLWALGNALRSDGYAVNTAESGASAVEIVAHDAFATVFVDAMLPDWDGLDLAGLIHNQQPGTTIVLVSGYFYAEDPAVREGMRKGIFSGFIAKPFDLQEIRRLVRQAVGRNNEA